MSDDKTSTTVERVNGEERKTIWEAMLDTEQAARYWAKIAYQLQSRDKLCGYIAFLLTVGAALTIGFRIDWWAQFATSANGGRHWNHRVLSIRAHRRAPASSPRPRGCGCEIGPRLAFADFS